MKKNSTIALNKIAIRQEMVLAQMKERPVVVEQDAEPVGVLIALAEWHRILDRLEELQDFVDVLEAKLELATGEDAIVDADIAQLQEMSGHAVPA